MDDLSKLSSDELKGAISNFNIDEQNADTPGGYEPNPSGVVDEDGEVEDFQLLGGEESEQLRETPEAYSQRMWQENQEEKDQEAREAEEEKRQSYLAYLGKRIDESGGGEQFAQNFHSAQASDYQDLRHKYYETAPLVDAFAQEYAEGRIKLNPDSMRNDDNPHEAAFWKWIESPRVQRRYNVTIENIAHIIRMAAEQPPLRSKSKSLMFPGMVHPRKKAKR